MAEKRNRAVRIDMDPDFLAAFSTCRERRGSGLLFDPFPFSAFDDRATQTGRADHLPLEVDFVTQPKQSGGIRLELVLDFATSVHLQVLAQRLTKTALPLPHSISALALDPGYAHLHPYELWRENISTWVRHRLVEGKSVVLADIRNYFTSIEMIDIEDSLRKCKFGERDIKITIQKLEQINSVRDQDGATRRGIPVAQDNLFWLLADLVLHSVDEQLAQNPNIVGYIRWVDDFFIAVEPPSTNAALEALSTALAPLGLALNHKKTRTIDSLSEFEKYALTFEHRMVTSLMMAAIHGPLSASQQDAFRQLVEADRIHSIEHARLWKRIYVLAAKLQSPALVNHAFIDLDIFPTIEKQMLMYLNAVDWPYDTVLRAINQLVRSPTDSQSITILKTLLLATLSKRKVDTTALRTVATSSNLALHPYAQVLLQACLMFQCSDSQVTVAQKVASSINDLPSPLARRLAFKLLCLIPDTENLVVESSSGRKSYRLPVPIKHTNVVVDDWADLNWIGTDTTDSPILHDASLNAALSTAFSEWAARAGE